VAGFSGCGGKGASSEDVGALVGKTVVGIDVGTTREVPMPTYMCYAHGDEINAEQKLEIAAGIARIHSQSTGAPIAEQ
jgi:hypothetical protein